jgi:hypothetical protein
MATDGKVTFWDATSGQPTYNAQEMRQLDSPLLMPGPASAPFSGRSGRQVNNSGLAVTVDPTGAGSVTVSQGAGVIYDGAYAIQGAWRFATSGAKTVALAARPGSGTSRIDLVVARIYDSALAGAGSAKELKIEVVTGSANATPSAPALPPLSLLLSTLTVTSTSGAAISKTDTTAVTVAAGGILPVATTAERDALVTAGIAYRGLVVDNAQKGALERYTGAGGVWDELIDTVVDYSSGTPGFSYASGYAQTSTFQAQLARDGKSINMRGLVNPTSGTFTGGVEVKVGSVTIAAWRPDVKVWRGTATDSGGSAMLSIDTNGDVAVKPSVGAAWISLHGNWRTAP